MFLGHDDVNPFFFVLPLSSFLGVCVRCFVCDKGTVQQRLGRSAAVTADVVVLCVCGLGGRRQQTKGGETGMLACRGGTNVLRRDLEDEGGDGEWYDGEWYGDEQGR